MGSLVSTLISQFSLPVIRFRNRVTDRKNLVILCYHRINEKTGLFYDRNISAYPHEFERQLLYIKKHFNVISISQLIDCYYGNYSIKPNSIMITFDDGFRDNALNAFPLLKKLEIPAIVFVTTGFIDSDIIPWEDQVAYIFHEPSIKEIKINNNESYLLRFTEERENAIWQFCKRLKLTNPEMRKEMIAVLFIKYQIDNKRMENLARSTSIGYLTKNDIKYWNNYGIDFGIHTVNHPRLTTLKEERMYREISESKRSLEAILEKPVSTFAYPYGKEGDFNETTKLLLKKAGITVGMIFEQGINYPYTDSLELRRFGIGRDVDFKLACYGFTKYRDILRD